LSAASHPIGCKARLAMGLMLYTGQRRGDAVLLGPHHLAKGWLVFTQQKNRKRKPIKMEIPLRPELQDILAASPTGKTTFLVTEFGKPFSANGFGNWFRKQCDHAGLPHCTAHGLRKAAAARLAELGGVGEGDHGNHRPSHVEGNHSIYARRKSAHLGCERYRTARTAQCNPLGGQNSQWDTRREFKC